VKSEKAMVKLLIQRLLARLGLQRSSDRLFALDAALVEYVNALAQFEQRPAEEILSDLLASGMALRGMEQDTWKRWMALSPREQQVAALVCLDYTNRQIAARLVVSVDTVKTHMHNVLVKFNLHSRGELRMLLEDWDFSAWEKTR
jgi:DNA-binding NarL/FixJ family response regulator